MDGWTVNEGSEGLGLAKAGLFSLMANKRERHEGWVLNLGAVLSTICRRQRLTHTDIGMGISFDGFQH